MQSEGATPACPPVLLVGFNRLDLVKRNMASIAAAAPARLYVACDGARAERVGEASKVAEQLHQLVARIGANEAMVTAVAYDTEARVRSLQLLNKHW